LPPEQLSGGRRCDESNDPAWLEQQYNNRARCPTMPDIFAQVGRASALRAAAQAAIARSTCAYGDGAGETLDLFPSGGQSGQGARCWSSSTAATGARWTRADHSFVAPSFNADGCAGGGAQLRAGTGGHAGAHHAADGDAPSPGSGDTPPPRRRSLRASSSPATRRAAPGGHAAVLPLEAVADDLPAQLVAGALSISGLYDLEPLRHTPFLQADLRLTPASVKRLSPAFFPRPKGAGHGRGGRRERGVPAPEPADP
jgi:arylformamidase